MKPANFPGRRNKRRHEAVQRMPTIHVAEAIRINEKVLPQEMAVSIQSKKNRGSFLKGR